MRSRLTSFHIVITIPFIFAAHPRGHCQRKKERRHPKGASGVNTYAMFFLCRDADSACRAPEI